MRNISSFCVRDLFPASFLEFVEKKLERIHNPSNRVLNSYADDKINNQLPPKILEIYLSCAYYQPHQK